MCMQIVNTLELWNVILEGIIIGITVFFGFRLKKKDDDNVARLNTYNLLIEILIEIKRKIKRCERLLDMYEGETDKEGKLKRVISYSNLYTPTFDNVWSKIAESNPKYEIMDDIAYIYEKFEFIRFNINIANEGKEKIDSERWGTAMAFIRNYLLIIYKKYNLALSSVKGIAMGNNYNFPKTLSYYDKEYVNVMKGKLMLEEEHLDD